MQHEPLSAGVIARMRQTSPPVNGAFKHFATEAMDEVLSDISQGVVEYGSIHIQVVGVVVLVPLQALASREVVGILGGLPGWKSP
jgi:hypothetical protein